MPDIISRKEAQAAGLKRYFTGKPCKHGHVAERYTDGCICCECGNERCTSAYHNDPGTKARMRERNKAWSERNPGRHRELQRAWRDKNREYVRQRQREKRAAKPWEDAVRRAKRRAADANLEFDLTKEWAMSRWTGLCEFSGVAMTPAKGEISPFSPSIDKVDQTRGYTQDNCRFVCMAVNWMRGGLGTDEQMLEIAKGILTKNSSPQFTCDPIASIAIAA